MRPAQKRQLLELTDTLQAANDEIKGLIEEKDFLRAGQLLEECQEAAIAAGNILEKMAEGKETVVFLEEYCEMLYQINEGMQGQGDIREAHSRLYSQLLKIKNSIRNHISVRREVIFLPYKSSMWDSLESIYLAAEADKGCDAYVIPIPYFDKNPDGTLGKMHYEGENYPENVPVTSWQGYDIAKREPDIIFIHNPYDEYNYVTSVHPAFYAKELKKHTEMLVYVPYFISAEQVQEHFCTVPAVWYADCVITQSKEVNETYKRIFIETFKGTRETEEWDTPQGREGRTRWETIAEEKFLPLGSPKLDKLYRTDSKTLKIPEEWKRLIQNADGTEKKVILYNTNIDALLRNNERYIEKILAVFKYFRGNPQMVLLWRPHPLNEATLQAMRPALKRRYMETVENYRKEGWGIFDDTPDLHRAIAVSDAYYGDRSSVAVLYREAGKPIMIQDSCFTAPNRSNLWMEDICIVDGEAWFSASNVNGIYSMNLKNGEVKRRGCFLHEKSWGNRLFAGVLKYGNRLLFIPLYAGQICIFHMETGDMEYIDFTQTAVREPVRYEKILHFMTGAVFKNYAFLLPHRYPGIIRIDMETNEIICFSEWISMVEPLIKDADDVYFRKEYVIEGNILEIPFCNANAILRFDMSSGKAEVVEVEGCREGFCSIQAEGDRRWLLARHSPVLYLVNRGKIIQEIVLEDGTSGQGLSFTASCKRGENLWIYPGKSMGIRKWNTVTGRLCKEEDLPWEERENCFHYMFPYVLAGQEADAMYVYDMLNGKLIACCTQEKGIKEYTVLGEIPSEFIVERIREYGKDKTFHESKDVTLSDYLTYVANGSEETGSRPGKQAGAAILSAVLQKEEACTGGKG